MREFLRENPHFKVSIIITISAVVPMLYLAVMGIIRGEYLVAICGAAAAVILVAADVIMIGRRYRQYRLRTRYVTGRCDVVDEYKGCLIPGGYTVTDYGRKRLAHNVRRHHSSFCAGVGMLTNCVGIPCSQCILGSHNRNTLIEWLKLKTNEAKENETMKENKTIEEFLRPGVLFKTESGNWYINIRGDYAYNVTLSECDGCCIKSMRTNIFSPKDVVEAYDSDETATGTAKNMPLLITDIELIINGCPLPPHIKTWKRPEPVKEMTMSELEKHFGCRVKIVKEN